MRRSNHRGAVARRIAFVSVPAVLAVLFLTRSTGPGVLHGTTQDTSSPGSLGFTTLHPVGTRYVGDDIPISGYTTGIGGTLRLILQEYSTSRDGWTTVATAGVHGGAYGFPPQHGTAPGRVRFRTLLYAGGRQVDTSNVLTVQLAPVPAPTAACQSAPSAAVCPRPQPVTQERTVDVPDCALVVVTSHVETRAVPWRWDKASARWVQDPAPWAPTAGTEEQRPAGLSDCTRIVDQVPAGAALPDLRIKDLTRCGKGDAEATGGTCFVIIPSATYDADFPTLSGKKLLKFGVITVDVGAGPGVVVAERPTKDSTRWGAYQNFYDRRGALLGSVADPDVDFYLAGDGHDHWHVRDFDDYELLDASGTEVTRAEKHGYCMQDNTTYDAMAGRPDVPTAPVFPDTTTCGEREPDALMIVHGLSVGWGDTYPTSLADQAVDITDLPDGVYTVRVHADAHAVVTESDEGNNTATVRIRIAGDTVTVVPHSSAGGVP